MFTQNFNIGRLGTTKKKKKRPAPATAVENFIGPRTVPNIQKNVKTAISSDIRPHSVETEK